jgi:hypothetical protein
MKDSTKSVSLGHDEACPSSLKHDMHNRCDVGGRRFVGTQTFSPNARGRRFAIHLRSLPMHPKIAN